ncbi:MAG: hypothetical protein C9356_17770 [Oleiphilus sp.]|nr:MAG: hypothetical protein C9356_17770 [Oleiphilus sp.]
MLRLENEEMKLCFVVRCIALGTVSICVLASCSNGGAEEDAASFVALAKLPDITSDTSLDCKRNVNPIATEFGNNHDAVVLPGGDSSAYQWYMIISGPKKKHYGQLYGSNYPTDYPSSWTLIDDHYISTSTYEIDDGLTINNEFFVFEKGSIFHLDSELEAGSGKWEIVSQFPEDLDDVGVYFDGDTLHMFGEFGKLKGKPDGIAIGYYIADFVGAPKYFSNWRAKDNKLIDPNTNGSMVWGVGDPSLMYKDGLYYLIADIESYDSPYRVGLWVSEQIDRGYKFAGILLEAEEGTDSLLNYRVQDGEFLIFDETIYIFANWRDVDGDPGLQLPAFESKKTRVVGGYECNVVNVTQKVSEP